jgi:DNA-binding NtrC family response regulator
MITGAPELSQAVELTRNGLFDYLTKPLNSDDFTACLARAQQRLSRPPTASEADDMIGSSPAIREAMTQLRQAAKHASANVLLLGETGTGKDLAARLLHRLTHGERANGPRYVALNCPAVPSEMFEAELFGSERGAYTGADKRRTGLVEAAEGGTLFLDEVTEIPLQLQAKLLRFLESREYRPLGSTETKFFGGRVVAATNRTLAEQVRAGRFREDLMYRLDVTSIRIPPLRERLSDIPPIAEFLLTQLCAKYERRQPALRPADLQALCGYGFPGNVRELRNILERSLLRTNDDAAWLIMDLGWMRGAASSAPVSAPAAVPSPLPASNGETSPPHNLSAIELQEYQLIQKTLREEGGAIRRSAAKLGLTHQALLRRLQKWPELREGLGSS